ncbi:hypothetical protein [Flindersiella endophytica]
MADTLDPIRRLDPLGSKPATVSGQTKHALAEAIMTSVAEPSVEPSRPRRYVPARRLALAGVVAAAGVLLVTGPPWSQPGRALAFTDEGDYFDVRVLDVEADADQYNEEFERYSLDVELKVVPVSPSLVGRDVMMTGPYEARGVTVEHEPAECGTAGRARCVPVLRVPHDLRGEAKIWLGRAAQPGEDYVVAGEVDGRGEALEGLAWPNKTVAQVREMLARRDAVVAEFRVDRGGRSERERSVPGNWYVNGALPWKPGEVLLFVSPHPAR